MADYDRISTLKPILVYKAAVACIPDPKIVLFVIFVLWFGLRELCNRHMTI